MRAVAVRRTGEARELVDVQLPDPTPDGRDLLIEVKAISVNPVDYKRRRGADDGAVLGYDAAGVVRAAGPDARLFAPGDEVFYAGVVNRPGTNAALHLVDDRIVGTKPRSLNWAEAAALPLTSITAWEALFERLDVRRSVPGAAGAILIVGGAGGVGSIATQIARTQTQLTVIATASRPETVAWSKQMGAHHVVDHREPLAAQVAALGIGAPEFIFSTTQTDAHAADIAELIAPQGRFALIDHLTDANLFMRKSVSIHWELMFTRPIFDTPDIGAQGELLNQIAQLVDAGVIRSTLTERLSPIDAATLTEAHAKVESGTTRGKIVLEGFGGRAEVQGVTA